MNCFQLDYISALLSGPPPSSILSARGIRMTTVNWVMMECFRTQKIVTRGILSSCGFIKVMAVWDSRDSTVYTTMFGRTWKPACLHKDFQRPLWTQIPSNIFHCTLLWRRGVQKFGVVYYSYPKGQVRALLIYKDYWHSRGCLLLSFIFITEAATCSHWIFYC